MAKTISIFAPATYARLFKLAAVVGALLLPTFNFTLMASENNESDAIKAAKAVNDKVTTAEGSSSKENVRESIFGESRPLDQSHFTWGADLGASVDLTAHDMSTFDLDFVIGYKNKFLKTVGIGAGIHRTVQGGDNFIPVYALVRTSFTSRPSLLFLNARFGYSFNTVEDSPMFGDYNSGLGCGINLSQSSKAKSYIIVGVAYRYFNKRHQDYISRLDTPYIWMAQLQFGVNF
ncbi:MAG: hypothetical protein K2J87_01600 [Muribaculaceae bacterium]|nr:hypothetical protein [Muribaculaceae bacterium]